MYQTTFIPIDERNKHMTGIEKAAKTTYTLDGRSLITTFEDKEEMEIHVLKVSPKELAAVAFIIIGVMEVAILDVANTQSITPETIRESANVLRDCLAGIAEAELLETT